MSKRYLIRTNISPFDNPTYYDAVRKNVVRSNSGNLLFPHSLIRALMTDDDTVFDPVNTHGSFSDAEIDRINASYDAFLIPLANAFRISFMEELANLTALIRRLSIPCIVVGIGFQGNLSGDISRGFKWADTARDFCKAVLEKSAKIGLRGETTAKFMDYLGFQRGKDYQVIGCPSMFLYGADLPAPKPLSLSPDIRIHINSKVDLPQKLHDYLKGVCDAIPDHYYLPQNQYELVAMYAGIPLSYTRPDLKSMPAHYPTDPSHPLFKSNRIRGFVTVPSWLDFLRQGDLNFGSRIHGNIAAILAGIPAFIIAPDSRVLELAEYHRIPHTTVADLDENTSVFDLLENVNFNSVLDGHKERFEAYLQFLCDNDLPSIYHAMDASAKSANNEEDTSHSATTNHKDDASHSTTAGRPGNASHFTTVGRHETYLCPFDKKISDIDFRLPLVPYRHLAASDHFDAMRFRYTFLAKRMIKGVLRKA